MPRRIIYIKNPSHGSHFRTINGGGSSRPSTKPPKPPKPSTLTGGALYASTPSNWFVHKGNDAAKPYFGELPGYGIDPNNVMDLSPDFIPAETIWGSLYLIVQGIDPNTGDVLSPSGTPGTLRDPIMLEMANMEINAGLHTGGSNPAFYGNSGDLPSGYTVKHPKRNQKRPWWAR